MNQQRGIRRPVAVACGVMFVAAILAFMADWRAAKPAGPDSPMTPGESALPETDPGRLNEQEAPPTQAISSQVPTQPLKTQTLAEVTRVTEDATLENQDGSNNEALLSDKITEIQEHAVNRDDLAVLAVAAELKHPSKAVRHAAIEALIDLDDRDAVPFLKEAVEATEDPREKVELLDAIDRLQLPTFEEFQQAKALSGAGTRQVTNPSNEQPPPSRGLFRRGSPRPTQ